MNFCSRFFAIETTACARERTVVRSLASTRQTDIETLWKVAISNYDERNGENEEESMKTDKDGGKILKSSRIREQKKVCIRRRCHTWICIRIGLWWGFNCDDTSVWYETFDIRFIETKFQRTIKSNFPFHKLQFAFNARLIQKRPDMHSMKPHWLHSGENRNKWTNGIANNSGSGLAPNELPLRRCEKSFETAC